MSLREQKGFFTSQDSSLGKPHTLREARMLRGDPRRLREMLEEQLILLAFSDNGSVAIKALDMLLSRPTGQRRDDFADVPTEVLEHARGRAAAFLRQLGSDYTKVADDVPG